ncbi:MAG: mechanosensitive ion channel family protein [Muribaculaceae bacterium]|nr:mechanosensitive ion channel family protein [Muribaculaceae bacterium]
MKNISAYFIALLLLLGGSGSARAQLIQRAENLIRTVLTENDRDSMQAAEDSPAAMRERLSRDSARMAELEQRLREMTNNELMLLAQIDNVRNEHRTADSLKLADQRHRIDSLRAITPGVPVVVEGDTLMVLYANRGGYTASERAAMLADAMLRCSRDKNMRGDTLRTLENEGYTDIMCGHKVLHTVSDLDAMWEGTTRTELAAGYVPVLAAKLQSMHRGRTFLEILSRAALFVLVVVVQYLLFRLTNYLFRKLRRYLIRFKQQKLKPVIIRDYELLDKRRLGRILIFFCNILRYLVLLTQLMFSVPILFAIFPQTEKLALTILHYILEPVRMVLVSIVDYIPNLFIIVVIWLCIRYLIKGLRYIAGEIESEKLKINGFYPDWARPTFNIVRFLLYAFMIAMVYPYLPGADSGVFQGISVFVGLIVSLGSSTVIGNIIAGLVITYMRPFKLGDRIKLDDTTGNVIEKTPFVTRLRTPKNEVVTIPNSFIMSSHTVNYSASARRFGLIIHTTVTIGYDAPWRLVHQLLINAARMTPGVLEDPKPFVLETDLQDYYPCYQINAYIKDADRMALIMSELHRNIQDVFNEAGVEIMSPHYVATRDGNASTIPADEMKGTPVED